MMLWPARCCTRRRWNQAAGQAGVLKLTAIEAVRPVGGAGAVTTSVPVALNVLDTPSASVTTADTETVAVPAARAVIVAEPSALSVTDATVGSLTE